MCIICYIAVLFDLCVWWDIKPCSIYLYLVLCVIKAVKNRHDIKVCAVFCRVSSCFAVFRGISPCFAAFRHVSLFRRILGVYTDRTNTIPNPYPGANPG